MKKKNSNIKATGVLLVLILMLMVGLIYINNINSMSSLASKGTKSLSVVGRVDAKEKNSMVCSVDELLAEATGVVVRVQNITGEEVWNKSLASNVLGMKSAGDNLYVLDNSKRLYCMSKSGQVLWEKELDGEIKDFYIERSGDVLLDYTYSGGAKIQILSGKGVDEGSIVLENAQVISFASGKEENTLSVIDISSQIIKTKILTLNLKGELVWSENIDNQIIPMLGYSKDNSLIAIGEKAIYKYKDKSKNQNKLELNKTIYNASISEGGIAAVVRNKTGFEVICYDSNLKELGHLQLDQAPTGINLGKSNYIIYYSEKLLLADLKGSILGEYKSMPEIKKAYFSSDDSIISLSDRLIQKLGYK
ncbi:MAG: hypothetical protein K0Q99_288 [Clostridia bacterium]|nr:hypothetical protein [Clostridia bacterium]